MKTKGRKVKSRLGGKSRFPMPPAAAVASLERGSALDRLEKSNARTHRSFKLKLKGMSPGMKTLAIVGGIGVVGVAVLALVPASKESFGS